MHQAIRDKLEDLLKGSSPGISQDIQAHLESCEGCAGEMRLLEKQAEMLRLLKAGEEVEPRAGFYARVMDRIEEDAGASMWAVLLRPSFGRRLAVASAALVVLLGTYLVTSERSEPQVAANPSVVFTSAPAAQDSPAQDSPAPDSIQQERQRDAVLVNLAAYRQ